jgi:hypothetical protein
MTEKIRRATHTGDLHIGGMNIPCAVLEDGTRVLSDNGITNALLGSRSGYSKRRKLASQADGAPIPMFLAPGNLKPFIDDELMNGPLLPIKYQHGKKEWVGYNADILPAVCDVWLRAREAGDLQDQQLDKAKKAEILMRGLAHVGITALVDEATGYQEIRDRAALQAILDKYLLADYAKWAKRFPDDFYREMFRLRGWQWKGMKVNRPSVVGTYTNNIVYDRLAPGLREELRVRNPKDERGNKASADHSWLTPDLGVPALNMHIHAVMGLMRAASTWDQFMRSLQRAFPKLNTTPELPGFDLD